MVHKWPSACQYEKEKSVLPALGSGQPSHRCYPILLNKYDQILAGFFSPASFWHIPDNAFDFSLHLRMRSAKAKKQTAVPNQPKPKASLNLPCQSADVQATCAAHQVIITLWQ